MHKYINIHIPYRHKRDPTSVLISSALLDSTEFRFRKDPEQGIENTEKPRGLFCLAFIHREGAPWLSTDLFVVTCQQSGVSDKG